MKRLIERLNLGLDEWEQIAFKNPNDEQGLYNIVDVVEHRDEEWARQILLSLAETVADYEDTGLTPERITEINDFFNSQTAKILAELQEYQKAEENGLLLRLPCKVGDTVFVLMKRGGATDISNGKVRKIHCGNDGIWWVEFCDLWVDVEFGDFGKIAFLAREEAEAKLAEMEGGHEC